MAVWAKTYCTGSTVTADPTPTTALLTSHEPLPKSNVTDMTGADKSASSHLHVVPFNCKNIKTCGPIVNKLFQTNDITLIQEHWLFESQLYHLGELHEHVIFAGKGVDRDDPLLPICMPRGYGGVAILWRKEIDHMIKAMDQGSERIQCIEIRENNDLNIPMLSVYLPAKGSKYHLVEYQETIDQMCELYQKYEGIHKIIIGGDINEDLNEKQVQNATNTYMIL